MRGEGRPGRVPDVRRLRRGGRGGQAGRGRAGRPRRRARHPARRPQRPGRRLHAGQAVRPDRRAVPARRPHRRRQPERQLRVELHEPRPGDRCRDQPRRVGRQRRRRVVADYLDFYADDPATAVGLAYIEGITDGRALLDRLGGAAARKPLVLVKGGATEGGARGRGEPHRRAGRRRQGVRRRVPRRPASPGRPPSRRRSRRRPRSPRSRCPTGPNVVVLTTAGGWGVVTADAIARDGDLRLLALPDDLRDAIDQLLPPRWSRNNPVDCAGGETRDTIPEVMRLIAEHPDVHAIVYLGLGIQSNQARMMRDGRLLPRPRAGADRRLPRAPGRAIRRGRRRAEPRAPASRS